MCFKQRYPTASDAQRDLRRLRKTRFRKDRALNVYRCPECRDKAWHIGHRSAA